MGLFHYLWSRTAASNASSDANIDWAEGMAPSAVNDSARSMMASLAGYRDDIAGAIATGGTSTAYTVTSYQVFDTLAHLDGQVIAFTPHATNGATVTLNVDGLGAKPLRSAPSAELLAGTIIQGTPYLALYNHSDQVFYLHGFYGNPYNIPLAGGLDYWAPTAPNSSFVFPVGQAVSRTTYSTLFSLVGTTYGTGDGTTTFNLPDKRGRVSASPDNMGGSAASRLTDAAAGFGDALGEAGGAQTHALTAGQIPTLTSANAAQSITVTGPDSGVMWGVGGIDGTDRDVLLYTGGAGSHIVVQEGNTWAFSGSNSISVTSSDTGGAGGGTASGHSSVQPTICCNYIMRII